MARLRVTNEPNRTGLVSRISLVTKSKKSLARRLVISKNSYVGALVCRDFTHGMNSYGFDLATVLVLDDKREGFPAAFIVSNRQDRVALEVAFKAI
ncbi:hypothetical protein CDAR_243611 [Caerostris darwini]|uniref:Uncharacterized protein n=1 Tax=Caerostris darwini TaxID=1538125 RepID=A0AAV4VD09_9ARAC|nr:hypothetical protein CDAR_243611 [Caerostris darwini]